MDNQEFAERRMCDAQTIEKHMEYMHKLDKRIDKLVTLQENTTNNINTLTEDFKSSMCSKNKCKELTDRLDRIEERREIILHDYDKRFKHLWFFEFAGRNPKMVGLMVVGAYALAISDVRVFLTKILM